MDITSNTTTIATPPNNELLEPLQEIKDSIKIKLDIYDDDVRSMRKALIND